MNIKYTLNCLTIIFLKKNSRLSKLILLLKFLKFTYMSKHNIII